MLQNIHIKNIVLIDEIDIDFAEGLNILTGETGAGKSIIIGAIGIALGGRFSDELLRDKAKDGLIELTFSVDNGKVKEELEELGISPDEEGKLLVQRKLSANGRTVNRINGETVNVSVLKSASAELINLHAQHEQQTLLKPAEHLKLLDAFGAEKISGLKNSVAKAYREYDGIRKELEASGMDEGERLKELDFLEYQIKEIEAASLKPGEDAEVEERYKKCSSLSQLRDGVGRIHELTGYDGGAGDLIGRALAELRGLLALDEGLNGISESLETVDSVINDLNRELSGYADGLSDEEYPEAQLLERLNTINSLKLKYGSSIEEIQDKLAGFKEKYDRLEEYDAYRAELNRRLAEVTAELEKASVKLSDERKKQSKKLCKLISEALLELNFSQAEFYMDFERSAEYSSNGVDKTCFMLSANVGEKARPLNESASGGELSRVMLALKATLSCMEAAPTMVFDEIDTGISGATAQKVADKLAAIARRSQVICITHLPQIAAMADEHFLIEKQVEDGRTVTDIRQLNEENAVLETARLIAGEELTDTAVSHAEKMRADACETKKMLT
ncbi:MAG: DNA repair protein RecN [Lachnospiraceae bacterium]|nr:DNA repair protein RecN [Lachnospiraceae bacterium]